MEHSIAHDSPPPALAHLRAPQSLELLHRRHELAELRKLLVAREQSLGQLRSQLVSFEGRYMRQVGLLYRRLDEWEQKIAELHGAASTPGEEQSETGSDIAEPETDAATLKAIYRDLVKLLHPDFATDAADEHRRTRLMALANDAYAREDAAAIRRMLSGCDPATTLRSGTALQHELNRVLKRISQVKQDLGAVELQIDELQQSGSAKLQERALEAARHGRDLLAEMAARVNGSIGLAMRRYELDLSRIQSPAKGPSLESLLTAETPPA